MYLKNKLLFVLILFLLGTYSSIAQSIGNACPENNDRSIFIVHGLLLANPDLESVRIEHGLNRFSMDQSKVNDEKLQDIADLSGFLRLFWDEKGVHQISDTIICEQITNALDSNEIYRTQNESFFRNYYKVDDKYLVIFTLKKQSIGPGRLPPHLILDDKFNVMGEMAINIKRISH